DLLPPDRLGDYILHSAHLDHWLVAVDLPHRLTHGGGSVRWVGGSANDKRNQEGCKWVLCVRLIQLRMGLGIHGVLLGIRNYTHDFRGRIVRAGAVQLFANGVLRREVESGHRMIDDPDTGSIFLVFRFGEITPADERYLHSPEVTRTHTAPSYHDGP